MKRGVVFIVLMITVISVCVLRTCVSVLTAEEKTGRVCSAMDKAEDTGKDQTGDKDDGTENRKSEENEALKKEVRNIVEKGDCYLILVNRQNKLPDDYNYNLRTICNGRLTASKSLYDDLVKMLDDAERYGHQYYIASAYRSIERQQYLVEQNIETLMDEGYSYEAALEETYTKQQPAGYSEHHTGLALDILASDNMNMDESQENSPANQWLQENCYKYGFILRYPKDKEMITEISYEPWHFRYVGKRAAEYIYEHDMTLEELRELLP